MPACRQVRYISCSESDCAEQKSPAPHTQRRWAVMSQANSLHPNCGGRTLLILFFTITLVCRGKKTVWYCLICGHIWYFTTLNIQEMFKTSVVKTYNISTDSKDRWHFILALCSLSNYLSILSSSCPLPHPPLHLPLLVVAVVWDCVWRLKLPVKERSARAGDSRVVQMLTLSVGESSGAKNSTLSEQRGELEKTTLGEK